MYRASIQSAQGVNSRGHFAGSDAAAGAGFAGAGAAGAGAAGAAGAGAAGAGAAAAAAAAAALSLPLAMDTVVVTMQRTAHSGDLAHLTIEDGISRAFDKSVRNQLRSIWNKVSKKTKQLVTDLGADKAPTVCRSIFRVTGLR